MHTSLQDLRVGARYALLTEPFVFAPHLGVTIPMADYPTVGFGAIGRHLKQVHFGATVARTIEPVLPNLYVMASYEFTLSEKYDEADTTDEIGQNRHDLAFGLGYLLLDGKLDFNVGANMRIPSDGVEFETFDEFTPEQQEFHDPLLKEDFIYLGAGGGYAITDKAYVGAFFRVFLRGHNTRDQNLFGINFAYKILSSVLAGLYDGAALSDFGLCGMWAPRSAVIGGSLAGARCKPSAMILRGGAIVRPIATVCRHHRHRAARRAAAGARRTGR